MAWLVILLSCMSSVENTIGQSQQSTLVDVQDVIDKQWAVFNSTNDLLTLMPIYVDFFENNRFSFDCGCNNNFGSYTMKESLMTVSEVGGTQMACTPLAFSEMGDPNRAEQELYMFFLDNPTIYWEEDVHLDYKAMVLSTPKMTLTLGPRDKLPPRPKSVPFMGTTWLVEDVLNTNMPVVRLEDGSPSVYFSQYEEFIVKTGCNEGRGSVTALSNAIVLSVEGFTTHLCSPESVSQMDKMLKKLFDNQKVFVQKDGHHIVLQHKDVVISFVAK